MVIFKLRRTWLTRLAVGFALVMMLSACGGSGNDDTNNPSDDDTSGGSDDDSSGGSDDDSSGGSDDDSSGGSDDDSSGGSDDDSSGGSDDDSSGGSDDDSSGGSDDDSSGGGDDDTGGLPDFFNEAAERETATAPADGTPSIPANLRVDLVSNDWVELNWTPSADNREVVEYRIYRNDGVTYAVRGDQTDPASGTRREIDRYWQTTTFIDCNYTRFLERLHTCADNAPEPGGAYSYHVTAVDDEGNESAPSNSVDVQLYTDRGAPMAPYTDAWLDSSFPYTTDLSTTDNFLSQFSLVFEDNFNGTKLDETKWNTRLTWGHQESINGEQQYFVDTQEEPDFGYNPFVVQDGILSIQAIRTPDELKEKASGQDFLSGALSTHDKFGFTFGYIEGRMKVGGKKGQLSSFYLFRRWETMNSPEIDIVEYLGVNPYGDEDAFQTYHYHNTVYDATHSSPTMHVKNPSGDLYSDDYHTFGVLWEPQLVVWYIDGVEVKRLSGPQISRQEMNIVTYQVTGSEWAPYPDLPDSSFPLRYDIDYIRVYQREEYLR